MTNTKAANDTTSSFIDRNAAIARIRDALRAKTGLRWSVTGGRGSDFGWLTVQAPPARRDELGYTNAEDRIAIAKAFGLPNPVHCQGLSISPDQRAWHVSMVEAAR
jgi:hypothetical protein